MAIALVFALALAGCASALLVPTEADVSVVRARWPDATLADLQRGRALYVSHCAGCHQLPVPAKRAPDEWPRLVDKMGPDAGLSAADKDLVARYLVLASARSRPLPAAVDAAIATSR